MSVGVFIGVFSLLMAALGVIFFILGKRCEK